MSARIAELGSRKRALVAGGPVELRRAICAKLGEMFAVVTAVADGEELMEVWRKRPGEFVMLHSTLALEGEGNVMEWLRAADSPPVILVFGPHDEAELVEKLEDRGASTYLPAWRVANELLEAVERVMARPAKGKTS